MPLFQVKNVTWLRFISNGRCEKKNMSMTNPFKQIITQIVYKYKFVTCVMLHITIEFLFKLNNSFLFTSFFINYFSNWHVFDFCSIMLGQVWIDTIQLSVQRSISLEIKSFQKVWWNPIISLRKKEKTLKREFRFFFLFLRNLNGSNLIWIYYFAVHHFEKQSNRGWTFKNKGTCVVKGKCIS